MFQREYKKRRYENLATNSDLELEIIGIITELKEYLDYENCKVSGLHVMM